MAQGHGIEGEFAKNGDSMGFNGDLTNRNGDLDDLMN
jgi:hypothetical protein